MNPPTSAARGSRVQKPRMVMRASLATSHPMVNQPIPILMILPTTPPKETPRIRVTRSRGRGDVSRLRSSSQTCGDSSGERVRGGPVLVPIQEEPNYSWVREDIFSFSSSMDSSLHIQSMRVHYNIVALEFLEKVKLLPCKEDECPFMHLVCLSV